jgi:quinol monooxygenase YgiN
MENLMAVAVFPRIAPEHLDQFKAVATEMLENIKKQDSVIRYEIFFNTDRTSCVVLEEYTSPKGVIEHVERNAKFLEELSALGGKIEGSMFPMDNESPEISEIRNTWDSKMHVYFNGKRT